MGLKFPLVTSKKDTFSFLILTILFLIGSFLGGCRFQPNPDLEFLTESEEHSCVFPQWAPTGDKIYYLDGLFGPYKLGCCGELWEVEISTHKKRKILGEWGTWFRDFAVSPDGENIALIRRKSILLLNLTTMELDTLLSLNSEDNEILDIEFSSEGDKLFYEAAYCPPYQDSTGLFLLQLEDKSVKMLLKGYCDEFDISKGDSIIVFAGYPGCGKEVDSTFFKKIYRIEGVAPRISPVDPNKVIIVNARGGWGYGDTCLTLWDFSDSTRYHLDTKIAKNGYSHCPDWSPDGKQIVFCASEGINWGGRHMARPSLWILKRIEIKE